VDFELTPDQQDLRDGVRKLLAGRFPMSTVRGLEAAGGVDRALWGELAEAGVFGLRLDESAGGAGLGSPEAVLVFEELGRALVPGPLIGTHLAAGLSAAGSVVGVVERDGDPLIVDYLAALDTLLVLDAAGVWSVDPSTVSATPVGHPLDPLTPLHRVHSLPRGEPAADASVAALWRVEGAVLASAMLLGIASVATERGVAYAKERQQFDRPIGSFQAVKHMLADMLTREEVARAAVYAAGVTLDDPTVGDPARAASVAKLIAGDAALFNAKTCIQVHRGMGFTWEVDAHLYLKRAYVLETVCGGGDEQAERLAALL
jgi:alkylation response protein AidB-like acyl-CoA dehydrogenase